MATAPNEGWEPREPREPQTKRMRASAILFGEEQNKTASAGAHLDSGSPASRGSHLIHLAGSAYVAALSAGVRLALRDELVEWTAEQPPTAELLAYLRDHKPEIAAILRGNACRWCGQALAWPDPVGVTFLDGTSECHRCADEDVDRRLTAIWAGQTGTAEPTGRDRRGDSLTSNSTRGVSGHAEG